MTFETDSKIYDVVAVKEVLNFQASPSTSRLSRILMLLLNLTAH